jgi:hypothetical protein
MILPFRTRVYDVDDAAFTEPPAWSPSPETINTYKRLTVEAMRADASGERPGAHPGNVFVACLAFGALVALFVVAVRSPHPFPGAFAVAVTAAVYAAVAELHTANVRYLHARLRGLRKARARDARFYVPTVEACPAPEPTSMPVVAVDAD